jgi:outer membrane protein TolC
MRSVARSLGNTHRALRAELNALLNRSATALFASVEIPAIERAEKPEEELFARAVERNPELAALRKEIEARGAGEVLAELEKNPDFMISGGVDDSLAPILSGGMTLPINPGRIRAGIAEALARRQAAEARLRNSASDAQGRILMALATLRDSRRILEDYGERIIPQTREALRAQHIQYGSGEGSFLRILETERTLIDFERLLLQARADRLRALGELEEALGEDLFGFQKP